MNTINKRIFDIVFSLPVTAVLLPVFAVIIAAIKLTSKGPAIFKQERAGKNGEPFVFYKFRTTRANTDPFGPSLKSRHYWFRKVLNGGAARFVNRLTITSLTTIYD